MATSNRNGTAAPFAFAPSTRIELLEALLEQISVSCNTLANFAAHAANETDGGSEQYTFHAVQAMAERIGAVAALPQGLQLVAEHIVGGDLSRAIVGDERGVKREGGAA